MNSIFSDLFLPETPAEFIGVDRSSKGQVYAEFKTPTGVRTLNKTWLHERFVWRELEGLDTSEEKKALDALEDLGDVRI